MDLLAAFIAHQTIINRSTTPDSLAMSVVTIRTPDQIDAQGMPILAADPWSAMLTFVRSTGIAVADQVIVSVESRADHLARVKG